MTKTLIERIEEAVTKDDLEPLAKTLSVSIDKRQGIETIRAELLEAAEALAEQGVTEAAALHVEEAPEQGEEPATPAYQGRMLKHLKNGRKFPWTAALAKNRYMQEV